MVVIFGFPVRQEKRGCDTQCLNFTLQSRHVKLFLSQNFVNVSHAPFIRNCSGCGLYRPSLGFAIKVTKPFEKNAHRLDSSRGAVPLVAPPPGIVRPF